MNRALQTADPSTRIPFRPRVVRSEPPPNESVRKKGSPVIISRAPVRVSFFGGGTDYPEYFVEHGGAVLSTAIDRFSYVTASHFESRLFDYSMRLSYRKSEMVNEVAQIENPVFRACLQHLGLQKDLELHAVADLPAFTGLGSSSAFTVSLLRALHAYRGEYVRPLDLAYEAIYVERHLLGECVGCQDQTAAAIGGFNVFEFRTETDIRVHPVPLRPSRRRELEDSLLLVFTGQKRRAAEVAQKQVGRVSSNKATLEAMRAMVDRGLDVLIGNGPLSAFGELLHQAWLAKRSLDPVVSNDDIDVLYREGLAAGALGGKLLGAGGGGFILFFVPPDRMEHATQALSAHVQVRFGTDAPGAEVIFS